MPPTTSVRPVVRWKPNIGKWSCGSYLDDTNPPFCKAISLRVIARVKDLSKSWLSAGGKSRRSVCVLGLQSLEGFQVKLAFISNENHLQLAYVHSHFLSNSMHQGWVHRCGCGNRNHAGRLVLELAVVIERSKPVWMRLDVRKLCTSMIW